MGRLDVEPIIGRRGHRAGPARKDKVDAMRFSHALMGLAALLALGACTRLGEA